MPSFKGKFYKHSLAANTSAARTQWPEFLPPANEVWGRVMFSQVFVCSRGGGVGGCIQSPWMQTPPPELEKQVVHILLKCFLFFFVTFDLFDVTCKQHHNTALTPFLNDIKR